LSDVADQAHWQVFPAAEAAWDAPLEALPADLAAFARFCGGICTPTGLVIGRRVRHAQRAVLGEEHPDDRSFLWYVIAESDESGTAERAVIDLDARRLGRCYDAFWDRFGVAGSMAVIATSFTDLLTRVIHAKGQAYWSSQPLGMGDAYD